MATEPHATPTAPGAHAGAAAQESHEGTAAVGHESGGLPQFDFQWWPGQIAWFLIVFAVVLAFMRFIAVPWVGGTIDLRESQIAGDIAKARRMKDEADAQAQVAAGEAVQARAAAQKVAADARGKAQAEITARLAAEDAKLAEAAVVAEARIVKARDAAVVNVAGIANDTAQAIVAKLTGKTASAAELASAQAARG